MVLIEDILEVPRDCVADMVVPKKEVFDYGACFYPEGMITSDQIFAFNHDQIEKICHIGYETDKQKELSKIMNDNYEKMQEGAKLANERLAQMKEKESQT